MRRALAIAALLLASSILGGCSFVANRIALAKVIIQCEGGRFTTNSDTLHGAVAACSRLVAMTIDGTSAARTAYTYRAFAYINLREYDRAIDDLEHERIFYPADQQILLALAGAYASAGRRAEAIAIASEIIHRTPKAASYGTRAEVYDILGDYDASIADYTRAIALDRKSTDYYNDRCWARAKSGKRYDLALSDCNMSLAPNPTAPAVLNSRGYVYYRMGSYQKAMADINASMKDLPDFPSSLYIRGLIEAKMGDKKAASRDEATAIAQAPDIAKSVVP